MIIWFVLLGYLGLINISNDTSVLKAFNPYYIFNMIANVKGGFWVLGAVFLCTTGAEALYSDLGHCGKKNIRFSWAFMSIVIVIRIGTTIIIQYYFITIVQIIIFVVSW